MTFIIDQVLTRLNEFTHPDEIAAQCAMLGLREPDPLVYHRSLHCPLAQAIGYQVAGAVFNDVAMTVIGRLPDVAIQFVNNFDTGQYPLLLTWGHELA